MVKKVIIGLTLALFVVVLVYFDLVVYGIGQGIGQMKVIMNSRPIEEMLNDPEVSGDQKNKLRKVGEIKQFAFEQIGLANSDNYTTFYDQGGKPILWVVRACEPYQLINKEWRFPIVGTVSYKGFFNLQKAKKLRSKLMDEGYDTYIREVSAWSTLGWFKDPLMSGSLNDSEGGLANTIIHELTNTIIHELTHATIFVKDSLTFNENLASFIGDKGAELYLSSIYGIGSYELMEYISRKEDRALFSEHFIKGTKKLDSLYRNIQEHPDDEKKTLKEMMIRSIVDNLDTISFHSKNYQNRFSEQLPNNAFFMSFLLYRSGQGQLDSLFQNRYHDNLANMVETLKDLYPKN